MRPVKGKKNASGTERRCADCHHERPAPTDRAASLMVVSHKLCQDCHKARKKGPVNCSGCHKANAQESQKSAGLMPADSLLPADGLLPTPKQQVAPATPAGNNTEAK